MRVRKKKWSAKELAENPRIIREQPRDWHGFFDNRRPLHIEIGCGKGRFIATLSARNPYINYIAVERDETILAAAARLARNIEGSLVFLPGDVAALHEFFAPGDISRMYINFCDPWPKNRTAKRRLTHTNFLAMYEKLLIPEIFFKTDNRGLFEFSVGQFSQGGWSLDDVSLDLHRDICEGKYSDNIMTEYEERFSALGPIYRLEARKKFG